MVVNVTLEPGSDPLDAISLLLELITWIALVPGILLLLIGYTRRALGSRFEKTWGIVIASPAGTEHPWFRFIDLEREMQTVPVPLSDGILPPVGTEVQVYFDPRNPQHARLADPKADGHAFRLVGVLLTAVGAATAFVQFGALLVE